MCIRKEVDIMARYEIEVEEIVTYKHKYIVECKDEIDHVDELKEIDKRSDIESVLNNDTTRVVEFFNDNTGECKFNINKVSKSE